ncbi:MAG: DNA repair protein RecO [Terriglobia bacterium]
MPLRETEAIVFRTYRLGEADKIVSLFSRQLGRIRAVAGGAQRPKSRYGGVLEPLTYIRVWLFERENRDLARLNSAELVESFFAMQSDYAVQLAAQYVAEASERLLPEREVNERAFRLLLSVLRGLKAGGPVDPPLLYFNYWLLRLGGFLPEFDRCAGCGCPIENQPASYDASSHRIACSRCGSAPDAFRLPAGAVALLEQLRRLPLARWEPTPEQTSTVQTARRVFEALVELHADKKLITRELMAQEM